jgi:hypothetical protein
MCGSGYAHVAGSGEGGRAGHRPGLAGQDLQVVVQQQVLGALVQAAGVHGDDGAADRVEDLQMAGTEPDLHPAASQADRDRVERLQDTDPRFGVDLGGEQLRGVEPLDGRARDGT